MCRSDLGNYINAEHLSISYFSNKGLRDFPNSFRISSSAGTLPACKNPDSVLCINRNMFRIPTSVQAYISSALCASAHAQGSLRTPMHPRVSCMSGWCPQRSQRSRRHSRDSARRRGTLPREKMERSSDLIRASWLRDLGSGSDLGRGRARCACARIRASWLNERPNMLKRVGL